jgi:hypothetical protein
MKSTATNQAFTAEDAEDAEEIKVITTEDTGDTEERASKKGNPTLTAGDAEDAEEMRKTNMAGSLPKGEGWGWRLPRQRRASGQHGRPSDRQKAILACEMTR